MAREKKNIEKLSFNMDRDLATNLRQYADAHYMTFTAAIEFAVKSLLEENRVPGVAVEKGSQDA